MYEYHGIGSFITLEGAELLNSINIALEVNNGDNVHMLKDENLNPVQNQK